MKREGNIVKKFHTFFYDIVWLGATRLYKII